MSSLARLLRSADARLRLDLVRPAAPRLDGPTLPPARLAPPLAASAVANALRWELARRDPASRGAWPAEAAPERLATLAPELVPFAEDALVRARLDLERPGQDLAGAAERALRLARLEAVVRAGYVDSRLAQPEEPEDVAEVADMLARVPWRELGTRAAAPPVLTRFADALPDAEPDALVDGTLLTVSASRAPRVSEDELRGLVVRLALARAEPLEAGVGSVGVLLARHGILWRAPADAITGREAFPQVEAWLTRRLERAQRESAPREEGMDAPRPGAQVPKWARKRFAPRTPGTHPEGKADKKKGTDAPRAPPPPRGERREPPGPAREEGQDRPSVPKPDWRRGSAWRRQRGL